MRRRIKDYKDEILELIHKDYSVKDLAKKFNFSISTIRNFKNIYFKDKIYPKITKENEEIIIGTVLGDSTILKAKTDKYSKIECSHGKSQYEYNKWKSNKLSNLKSKIKKYIRKTPNTKTGKYYEYNHMYLSNNRYFDYYHNLFYKNKKKIINEEIMKKYTNLSLAIHFMDDGFNDRKDYYLSTDCFDNKSLEIFQKFLLKKFNICTSINKYKKIRILSESRHIFESLIYYYVIQIPCMHYKLLTSPNPVNCLESPEEDNQQPSSYSDIEKGSTTSSESQADDNSTTKAGQSLIRLKI